MNQIIRIKRTVTAGNVPAAGSLQVGELAAGLADTPARMWIGVPTTIVPSGVLELFAGTAVEDAPDDQVYGRSNGDWVPVVLASATAPINPPGNQLWFNTTDGSLNIWYDDGTSQQWVMIGAGGGGGVGGAGGGVVIGDQAPADPSVGMLWVDDDQVFLNEPTGWVPFVKMSRWTLRAVPIDHNWFDVAYGNGLFAAVGSPQSGASAIRVMTSPDGIEWTARTGMPQESWNSIAFGNNTFVASNGMGAQQIMTSPDGITWTARTAPAAAAYNGVTFANGLFILTSTTAGNAVFTSPDGINWTQPIVPDQQWRGCAYGNGLFVLCAQSGTNRILTSPDAVTWTQRPSADDSIQWNSVAFGHGLFASIGMGGNLTTSPDGINWSPVRGIPAGFNVPNWQLLRFLGGLFLAGSGTNQAGLFDRILMSRDGINWMARAAPTDQTWYGIAYGNGTWVCVAYNGRVYRAMSSRAP